MSTFKKIMDTLSEQIKIAGIIEIDKIPNIDLYMDQVTTFMDKALSRYKRYEDDKILTKTMINNYTKAKIFPPPIKKKYSRMHLMLLILIYHLKAVLSIRDIGTLLSPILNAKTQEEQERMVIQVYDGFLRLQIATQNYMKASTQGVSESTYFERDIISEYQDENLKRILLVLLLAMRAYAEKQLAERLLDTYF